MTKHWHPLVFNDPIYGVTFIILFNIVDTDAEAKRVVKFCQKEWGIKIKKEHEWAFKMGKNLGSCTTHNGRILIMFKKGERLTNATMVHECVHAAIDVFAQKEIRVDTDHDEPLAYYIGWLVGNITVHGNKWKLW